MVDADSGRVLRRANLVKSAATARVWDNYPGAATGGDAATGRPRPLGCLTAGATTLDGPNVRAFSDLDDDDNARRQRGDRAGRRPVRRSRSRRSPAAGCNARARARGTGSANTLARRTATRTRCRPSTSPTASTTTSQRADRLHRPTGLRGRRPADAADRRRRGHRARRRPPQQREHVHAARRPVAADADVPVARGPVPRGQRRRRRVDPLPRVHARALEPARHRRRRRGRAELARRPARWARAGATCTPRTSSSRSSSTLDTPAPGEVHMGDYTDVGAELIRTPGARLPGRRRRRPPCPAAGRRARRLHLRRLRQDQRRARGPRRRRDLGRDAVGPAHARRLVGRRAADHRRACGSRRRSRRSWTCATRSCRPTPRAAGRSTTRSGRCSPRAGWASSRATDDGNDVAPIEDFSLPPAPAGRAGRSTGTSRTRDAPAVEGVTAASAARNGPDALAATTAAGAFAIERAGRHLREHRVPAAGLRAG